MRKIIPCPFCCARAEEEIKGLVWKIVHTSECFFSEINTEWEETGNGNGCIMRLQHYQIKKWNKGESF